MSASFFEPLETRQMLSANIQNGLVRVHATEANDIIAVSQDATRVRVNENGKVTTFALSSVKQIVINAYGGNDQIIGRPNLTKPMILRGGEGNDLLVGGPKSDTFEGGNGFDIADYRARSTGQNITLDGLANDGNPDERDNVRDDVEQVQTGSGNDTIRGSARDDALLPGAGSDYVDGMSGNDTIIVNSLTPSEPDTVYGGDGNDWIEVTGPSASTLRGGAGTDRVSGGSAADDIDGGADFDTIYGNDGNDWIWGSGSRDSIFGGRGNDLIEGGAGDDIIDAGEGDDTVYGDMKSGRLGGIFTPLPRPGTPVTSDVDVIFGGPGNDQLHGNADGDSILGQDGNDKIWGDAGNDMLRGNGGNDSLYGGDDNDNMSGDAGDDLLISIGGGQFDTLWGDSGSDNFWCDEEATEIVKDADLGEILFGAVRRVGSFANGVTRNLNGQNLPDPNPLDRRGTATTTDDVTPVWNNFKDMPFVASTGVSADDINQGQVGSCYFLAVLAGLAKQSKFRIMQSMVELGDGTYAFKFIRDGAHLFYRVDADLPVTFTGSTTPYYAGLGAENSTWAALAEKAWTFFRRGANSYDSINGGPPREAFNAFGMTDGGNMLVASDGSKTLDNIQDALKQGKIVTISTPNSAVPAGLPVVQNHAYVVDRVNTFKLRVSGPGGIFSGGSYVEIPISVTLRNPWGFDGAGADDSAADGLVTVTAAQLGSYFDAAQAAYA